MGKKQVCLFNNFFIIYSFLKLKTALTFFCFRATAGTFVIAKTFLGPSELKVTNMPFYLPSKMNFSMGKKQVCLIHSFFIIYSFLNLKTALTFFCFRATAGTFVIEKTFLGLSKLKVTNMPFCLPSKMNFSMGKNQVCLFNNFFIIYSFLNLKTGLTFYCYKATADTFVIEKTFLGLSKLKVTNMPFCLPNKMNFSMGKNQVCLIHSFFIIYSFLNLKTALTFFCSRATAGTFVIEKTFLGLSKLKVTNMPFCLPSKMNFSMGKNQVCLIHSFFIIYSFLNLKTALTFYSYKATAWYFCG